MGLKTEGGREGRRSGGGVFTVRNCPQCFLSSKNILLVSLSIKATATAAGKSSAAEHMEGRRGEGGEASGVRVERADSRERREDRQLETLP